MKLAAKLNLKPGAVIAVLAQPADVVLDFGPEVTLVPAAGSSSPGLSSTGEAAVLAFVRMAADLDAVAAPALAAARADRIAWIAYPKAKQLGTDLNRDSLARACEQRGATPVRQVSLTDIWSVLRFRPAKGETRWS